MRRAVCKLPSRASRRCNAVRTLATAQERSPAPQDSFANGTNAHYTDEMYKLWRQDSRAVHPSWDIYFTGMDRHGLRSENAFQPPPSLQPMAWQGQSQQQPRQSTSTDANALEDHQKIQLLVRAYQARGHHIANLDPLGALDADLDPTIPAELSIETYGWSEADLNREFELGSGILPRFKVDGVTKLSLREIVENLKRIYCGNMGIQYLHIPSREQCDWLRERLEIPVPWKYTIDEKRMILDRLIWSDSFERYIAAKYPNEKRFGLEGCESLIPGMKALIDRTVDAGPKSIVIGMPHRGRLNVLANVIRKPIEAILSEFKGAADADGEGGGDVKYHLGANYVRPTPSGKRVALSLVANPSHLESENTVVVGKVKALQDFDGHSSPDSSMGILLHGDAAFAGQGIVYEMFGLADLPNYSTGGTVHLIVNNQIGFTTDPRQGRSTPYPSDIAKSIDAPILHVNGDDPEAVTFVCQLAADWRAKFHKDVVIDVVCYRRHGHNETDQPMFTQPKMYTSIGKQTPTLGVYTKRLLDEGSFTQDEITKHKDWVWGMLDKAYEGSKDYKASSREWLSSSWEGFPTPKELATNVLEHRKTGVELDTLRRIGNGIGSWPDKFQPHKNLARILKGRSKTVDEGKNIDYSTAEALAFGSLALEGNVVRVSGQDVERGTFSQRHAILHDQETNETYMPLNHLSEDQAFLTICNSSLSEFGVLGFELGYSLVDPHLLTIWEAQFGDFANGAQIIIDQYVASGERKWLQRTGLVMSLPHGYDGQGPEHSSARIERFLQLCDDPAYVYPSEEKLHRQHQDANMQIVIPSTPASIFHVLRRQIHRDFRKPLILCFSKSLLRHPLARSNIEDLGPGTSFVRYLPDPHPDGLAAADKIRKHILCSGQVYYALLQARDERKIDDIAISRLEQVSPVPYDLMTPHLDTYPNADLVYAQEEPQNGGALSYLLPRLDLALQNTEHHKGKRTIPVSRAPTSSVATGLKKAHAAENQRLIDEAFA